MNSKTTKIIHWSGIILTSLGFGASGFFELTKNALVWEITQQLGYPAHPEGFDLRTSWICFIITRCALCCR